MSIVEIEKEEPVSILRYINEGKNASVTKLKIAINDGQPHPRGISS